MIRNTFAIATLLGLQETQAVDVTSHQCQKSSNSASKAIPFSDEEELEWK